MANTTNPTNTTKNNKQKKRTSFKSIILFFFTGIILSVLMLSFGYITFEFERLSSMNLSIEKDWRGYLTFLAKKVPILGNMVESESLQVGEPLFNQKEIMELRLEEIKKNRDSVDAKTSELNKLMEQITSESANLANKKATLEASETQYYENMKQYTDRQTRVKRLADLFATSTPQQIAQALSRDEVSVDLIVEVMMQLPADVASQFLQALSSVNPGKAAQVIQNLGQR